MPAGWEIQGNDALNLTIAPIGAQHTKYLYVKQPDDVDMIIQIWDARGWTVDGITELGAGIHVLPTARQGHG